jgi:CBS domain-containing protein
MRIRDVMTETVVTVTPDTTLKEAATLMLEHRISGLPVVDGTRVLGVLSETDVLFKEVTAPDRQGVVDWILHYGEDPPTAKLAARTAGDAMTAPAITVGPGRAVPDAAALMLDLGIDRLPVVEGDELVGIVTRSDFVRAFTRTDDEIEREIRDNVVLRTLWMPPDSVTVNVNAGEVVLEGEVDTTTVAELIESHARRVPGVVSVESKLHAHEAIPA